MKKKIGYLITFMLLFSFLSPALVSAAPSPTGPFESSLRLQNMGDAAANIKIIFYDAAGAEAATFEPPAVAAKDVLVVLVPDVPALASGEYSVVVESDQPIAAATSFTSADSSAAYTGVDQGATSWFIPGLYDDYYSYFSNVYVQNTSSAAVNITLDIYAPGNPSPVWTNTKSNVPANTTVKWDQAGLAAMAQNVSYAGIVTATGDVAPIINIYGSGAFSQQLYSYNGFMSGGTSWYTPVQMKDYYGWNTAIEIQNVSATNATVQVNYSTGHTSTYTILPNSAETIYVPNTDELPSGPEGIFSAIIESNVDIVVMVNESNAFNRAATYNGVATSSPKVFVPTIMNNVSNFVTSVTCQNMGNTSTMLEIDYFGEPGSKETRGPVPAGGVDIFYTPASDLPNGYNGSAIVTSLDGTPIACIVNQNMEIEPYFSTSFDMLAAYNAISE